MTTTTSLAIFVAPLVSLAFGQVSAQEQLLSTKHDGRWSVALVCADTKDRSGLVKGYEYTFVATVEGGKLDGHYGAAGSPGSVIYSGVVRQSGSLEISATGRVGNSAFAAGKTAQGTPYTYTLRGNLGEYTGQAERQESRPCTATLSKL